MGLKAIHAPTCGQDALLSELSAKNPLRTFPAESTRWGQDPEIGVGDALPTLWLHCGRLETRWVAWGKDPGGDGTVDGLQHTFARRCLVPAAYVDIEEAGRVWRLTPQDSDFLLIGAVWRPDGKYGAEPHHVQLMTTGVSEETTAPISNIVVAVAVDRICDWLDPAREARPLQCPGAGARIAITEVVEDDTGEVDDEVN